MFRSQDPSCCDWGRLCGTQNSLRSQATWRLGPVALGNEGRGQGTPRQRDLEPSETTRVEGLDYFETFAPTCKPEIFRILLQLSAKQGHVMHQFDVKTAFLHSPIEEKVYMEQPQEFVKRGSDGEKLVCRLIKSIYGLKQAANNRYEELANFLLRQGFTRSRNDPCFFAISEAEDHTFILVWVDDIIVASRSMTVVSDVKRALEATFHMEDRGRIHWFLGLRIRREEGKVTVDQERYIETRLERFQMDQCKPSRTPADLNLKF